jgi:hypothetical protein
MYRNTALRFAHARDLVDSVAVTSGRDVTVMTRLSVVIFSTSGHCTVVLCRLFVASSEVKRLESNEDVYTHHAPPLHSFLQPPSHYQPKTPHCTTSPTNRPPKVSVQASQNTRQGHTECHLVRWAYQLARVGIMQLEAQLARRNARPKVGTTWPCLRRSGRLHQPSIPNTILHPTMRGKTRMKMHHRMQRRWSIARPS